MDYISTKELASKWGVNPSRVLKLARDGRIEGAILFGNNWMYPKNTVKPADRRTRTCKENMQNCNNDHSPSSKQEKLFQEETFRFPIYINSDEEAFIPPLTEEEKLLRQAQLLYEAYRFTEAEEILIPLSEHAVNRYVRISAGYYRCSLSMYDNHRDFDELLHDFYAYFSEDFTYRNEMLLFKYFMTIDLGNYNLLINEFTNIPEYTYHPSTYPFLLAISLIILQNTDISLVSELRYETYEIICQQLEHEGAYREAQLLHHLLLTIFQLQNNKSKMLFHMQKSLEIAYEKNFYLCAAVYQQYYPDIAHAALSYFPEDFGDLITTIGKTLHNKLAEFTKARQNNSFLGLLSESDYRYAFLATQNLSNKEIAEQLNVSSKYVSRKFGEIYDKLGIRNRKELVDRINELHFGRLS